MNTCTYGRTTFNLLSTYDKVQILQLLNYYTSTGNMFLFMSLSHAYGQLLESSLVDGCRAGVFSSLGLWLNDDAFWAVHIVVVHIVVSSNLGIQKHVGENACQH